MWMVDQIIHGVNDQMPTVLILLEEIGLDLIDQDWVGTAGLHIVL